MQTTTLVFIIVSISATLAQAWQIDLDDDPNWLRNIDAKPSVYSEMNQYFTEEDPKRDAKAYIESFVPTIHSQMVNETQQFLAQVENQNGCTPSSEVSFPDQLTTKYHFNSKSEFESNFLKVESYACLGKLNINKVFETLMSEAFQRKAINGLKSIQLNHADNRACVMTKIFGLGTSNYCLTKNVQRTETQYIIQSFNEENINSPDAPVYFKETINVITQLPNGEISLYNLMYARSVDLSFKGIIRGKVEDQQEDVRKYLIEGAK